MCEYFRFLCSYILFCSVLFNSNNTTGGLTVEYVAAAWLPWVSISTMEKLEMEEQSPEKSRRLLSR